uniref:Uncharacterized protein n=1 Tax=Astyanax mexicanus TaxID=7994 RepID=A0A3B1IM15_ASTMX
TQSLNVNCAVAHACIPALWEAKVADHLRSGVQDQPSGQHGETPSLLKIQKKKIYWHWCCWHCSPSYSRG